MNNNIFHINNLTSRLKSPLFKNKFYVSITNNGVSLVDYALVQSVTVPAHDLTQTDLDIGGHLYGIPSKWVPNELIITHINQNYEYSLFFSIITSSIYNQDTHAFKYVDEIACDIEVTEYHASGLSVAWKNTYEHCVLKGISQIELTMEAATSIETFTTTWTVGYARNKK